MKRKILVFASTFPRWKNDTNPPFVYELSKRLTKDFEIIVLAPHYPGAETYEEMDGMKVYRFRYFLKKYQKLAGSGGILPTIKKNKWYFFQVPFFMLGEYLALRKLVKKEKPDMIHAHWIIPQGINAFVNYKISKIPYVVTTWGGDMFIFKKKGIIAYCLKKLYSKTINNSFYSTTVNIAFKEEMQEISKDKNKILYIPNGVDTKLFNPHNKDNSIKKKYNINGQFMLFVGRLTEKKGIEYIIKAMPKLIEKYPKIKLLIVGGGELKEELEKLSSELKVNNNVIFTGPITNHELPRYYASADLFIAPSIQTKQGDREGFPTVFLEAMASGTPIITTNIEGIREIIQEKKNGFIVTQKSSEELSNAILSFFKNKDNLTKMKAISREIAVSNYDWSKVIKQYQELLK